MPLQTSKAHASATCRPGSQSGHRPSINLIHGSAEGTHAQTSFKSRAVKGGHKHVSTAASTVRDESRVRARQEAYCISPEHLIGGRHAEEERYGDRHAQALVHAAQLPLPPHDLAAAAEHRVLHHLGDAAAWIGLDQGSAEVDSEASCFCSAILQTRIKKHPCHCPYSAFVTDETVLTDGSGQAQQKRPSVQAVTP